MTNPSHPPAICPKCGRKSDLYNKAVWREPIYSGFADRLVYKCVGCGYLLFTLPRDHKDYKL